MSKEFPVRLETSVDKPTDNAIIAYMGKNGGNKTHALRKLIYAGLREAGYEVPSPVEAWGGEREGAGRKGKQS